MRHRHPWTPGPVLWATLVIPTMVFCACFTRFLDPRLLVAAPAVADAVPAPFLADPLLYFFDAKPAEALRYGEAALSDPSTSERTRKNVLLTLGTIYLAQGKDSKAKESFQKIFALNPTAEIEEPCRLPEPVRRLFYRMRYDACSAKLDALVASGKLGMNIRTVAVGAIENNSIVKTNLDMDHFCRGLQQILMSDLLGATSLKVVDRQEIEVLLEELKLNRDPTQMNPEARVALGQLSGAQSYLFGQFMQIDKTHVRMDLRWVNTSTSEILLSRGVDGTVSGPQDFLKFERKLLVEMAPEIQRLADSTRTADDLQKKIDQFLEGRKRQLAPGASYTALVESYGRALASEDSGSLDDAIAAWEKVSTLSPKGASDCGRRASAYKKARGG